MISVTSNAREAIWALMRVQGELSYAMNEAVDEALDRIIVQLRDATPVRTGRMAGSYVKDHQDEENWVITNEAPYSPFVIGGTRHNAPNLALLTILHDEEDGLEKALNLALANETRRF